MNRLCLDTSAYSHFKRGHEEAVEVISSAGEVLVPVVVLGELRAGFRLGSQGARNEADLKTFLRQRVVRVLDVDDEASSVYADLMVELKRAGTPLPSNDVWIAALAAREGATVLTFHAHFASNAPGRLAHPALTAVTSETPRPPATSRRSRVWRCARASGLPGARSARPARLRGLGADRRTVKNASPENPPSGRQAARWSSGSFGDDG